MTVNLSMHARHVKTMYCEKYQEYFVSEPEGHKLQLLEKEKLYSK